MLSPYASSRVLVVDDNEPSAQLMVSLLGRSGLGAVESLLDPRRALQRIEELRPDLLVLDLHMPHVDGYAVLADVRRAASPADLPVLVLTADTTREAARRALSLGANDFVTKPVDLTEITLRVRNLLETRALYRTLRRRQRWLEAAGRVARELLPGTVGDPLRLVADAAAGAADADRATVLPVGPPAGSAGSAGSVGSAGSAGSAGSPSGWANPLVARVLADGPLLLDDAGALGGPGGGPGRGPGAAEGGEPGGDPGPALLVPLAGPAGPQGVLALSRRRGRPPFDATDVEMVGAFAGQAALALELARARALQETMAVLEDRHRIARDLHDHVIQRLFATGLRLQNIASSVTHRDVSERIAERVADLDDTILQIRTSIFQLRGDEDERGRPSVRTRVAQAAAEVAERAGVQPIVRFTGPVDTAVPDEAADRLLAAAREALGAVSRRPALATLAVEVTVVDGRLGLCVSGGDGGTLRWSESLPVPVASR